MRLLAGFALIFFSIAFTQGQLVVPQINNINALITLLPQFQGFLGQLDQILPQISQFASSVDLQSLKDKIVQVVLSQIGSGLNVNAIKDKLRPILQQFLGSLPQPRLDFDAILQQIAGAATTALPSIIMGLVGKRAAVDARINLNDVLALADKYQLLSYIPQLQQFLSPDKLQQLQNQFFATLVAAAGNNWTPASIAQAIQQLVSQYVPQLGQSRIDWESVGQSALNGLVTALPSVAIGLLSLFGKREARAGLDDILALVDKFQLQTLIPQIEQLLTPAQLQQLQSQFFSTVVAALGNNWNMDTLAQLLQQLVSQYVPKVAEMRIDWESIGQSALNGLAGALPSIAIGLVSLFGKREARAGLDDILALVDKFQLQTLIPQIEQLLTPAQLQQLQSQFFSTVVAALGNNWNMDTLAQLLQQLVSQYVPKVAEMRIDWESIGQTALNGLAGALPSIAIGLVSLFGKRDLSINYQQLLAQLPVDKLAQIVQLVLNTDKSKVLAALHNLLESFFPAYLGRINFDDLAANLLNHLNNLLPNLSQSIFSGILG